MAVLDLPLPNRRDLRRKSRASRPDESPWTKPSIAKRKADRRRRAEKGMGNGRT